MSIPTERLQAISSQLEPVYIPSKSLKMASRDQITCHVLDTTTGRPAAGIAVSLTCKALESKEAAWTATTDADGRIGNWKGASDLKIDASVQKLSDGSVWKLSFDTGSYYGEGKTFFPTVDLTFFVKGTEHYHVPLLLGPHSYTTYRGS